MRVRGLICRSLLLSAVALLTTTATTMAFAAEGPFHVEHTWQVGGEGGWDYIAVDPQTNLLYITRGDHVQVIDRESGKQVADIHRDASDARSCFCKGRKWIHQRRRRQPGGGVRSQDV